MAYEGENNNNHKRNLFASFPKTVILIVIPKSQILYDL